MMASGGGSRCWERYVRIVERAIPTLSANPARDKYLTVIARAYR